MKQILITISLLFVAGYLLAQFPQNPVKQRLGYQTSALGLIAYSDTIPLHTPSNFLHDAQIVEDTVRQTRWFWSGATWRLLGVIKRVTPPPATEIRGGNTLDYRYANWWRDTDSTLYTFNWDSECWAPVLPYRSASEPTDEAAGAGAAVCYTNQLWYNTTEDSLKAYTGLTWISIGGSVSGGGGGNPTGPAGGDLDGTYPNPGIATGAVVYDDLAQAVKDSISAGGGIGAAEAQDTAISVVETYRDSVQHQTRTRTAKAIWRKLVTASSPTSGIRLIWLLAGDSVGKSLARHSIPAMQKQIGGQFDGTIGDLGSGSFQTSAADRAFLTGATQSDTDYARWFNGNVYVLTNESQNITVGGTTAIEYDSLDVYYITESGGGTFTIETGYGSFGPYDTNGATGLARARIPSSTGAIEVQGSAVSIDATGTVYIPYIQAQRLTDPYNSIVVFDISEGGLLQANVNTTASAIQRDFFDLIGPDLVTMMYLDTGYFNSSLAFLNAHADLNDSTDFIITWAGPTSDDGGRQNNWPGAEHFAVRSLQDSFNNVIFYDALSDLGDSATVTQYQIQGDSVHLPTSATSVQAASFTRKVLGIPYLAFGAGYVNDINNPSRLAYGSTFGVGNRVGLFDIDTGQDRDHRLTIDRYLEVRDTNGHVPLYLLSSAAGAFSPPTTDFTLGVRAATNGIWVGTTNGNGNNKFLQSLSVWRDGLNADLVVERGNTNNSKATLRASSNATSLLTEDAPLFKIAVDPDGASNVELLLARNQNASTAGVFIGLPDLAGGTFSGNPNAAVEVVSSSSRGNSNALIITDPEPDSILVAFTETNTLDLYGSTWTFGTGNPEGVLVGDRTDFFVRKDGGTDDPVLYIKKTMGGNSGWVKMVGGSGTDTRLTKWNANGEIEDAPLKDEFGRLTQTQNTGFEVATGTTGEAPAATTPAILRWNTDSVGLVVSDGTVYQNLATESWVSSNVATESVYTGSGTVPDFTTAADAAGASVSWNDGNLALGGDVFFSDIASGTLDSVVAVTSTDLVIKVATTDIAGVNYFGDVTVDAAVGDGQTATVTLPVTMPDTDYNIQLTLEPLTTGITSLELAVFVERASKSTTAFDVSLGDALDGVEQVKVYWYVRD